MSAFEFGGEIVWRPSAELVAQSHLQQFMNAHRIGSLEELQRRSTTDIEWFWDAVFRQLGIEFYKPYVRVADLSRGIQWPQWCVSGEMNIVHNCLDKYAGTPTDEKVALIWEGEEGVTGRISYSGLRYQVNQCANALRSLGLGKGDAVGVFLPMTPECVVAMLAIIKIGGIFLPMFSGHGASAVASRLADTQAKALFTADGFYRRGQVVEMKSVADAAARLVPSVRHVIVVRRIKVASAWHRDRDLDYHDLVDRQSCDSSSEHTLAEDVLMLIYTSGTSGKPKGTVHTHCGFPIKAAQDMLHGLDLHRDETLFWVTDMGWMMGPWQVFGSLIIGATMLIYDGAPDFPEAGRLWKICEDHKVTTLGVSPTLVRSLSRHGFAPVQSHDLSSLRKFGSTGEPWNPESWHWLFDGVGGGKLPIVNYSGGTEISGGILMGNVLTPLKPCAFSGALPGMDADVVDENGNSVRGQVGELVIRKPWIGMTRGFWNDRQRYLDTYWSHWPNVWSQGDWAAIDADGLWYILGRSDDTIKVGGKRLGPAEVESILTAHPAVREAAAVGVPDSLKGQALVCFCVLKSPAVAGDLLRDELRDRIDRELGRPYIPRAIEFVGDLPKSRNGKVMRRAARAAYLGIDTGDLSALENPAVLDDFRGTSSK